MYGTLPWEARLNALERSLPLEKAARVRRLRRVATALFETKAHAVLGAGVGARELEPLWLTCWEQAVRADRAGGLVGEVTEYKDMPPTAVWQYKSVNDLDGTIEGYLATWDVDLTKDIIEPGSFRKTLTDARAFARKHQTEALYPFLWQHDRSDPIGAIVEASEDTHGLFITAHLNRSLEHGRQAFDGFKDGYLSFSIGYKPVQYEWKGAIRHLTEIQLAEGSAVTFPANPEARPVAS